MAESTRLPCRQCGASILPATAERNDGVCQPCYKLLIKRSPFGRMYEELLNLPRPGSSYYWLWNDGLEPLRRVFWEISYIGHCDSIFQDTIWYKDVHDLETLKEWALALIRKVELEAIRKKPKTLRARNHRLKLFTITRKMKRAVLLAQDQLEKRPFG